MRTLIILLILPALLYPIKLLASCSPDLMFFWQLSSASKKKSIWQINHQNPYRNDNVYNDVAVKYSDTCRLNDEKLALHISVYGLGNLSYKETGQFEKDHHHLRALIEQLSFSYGISDQWQLESGKIRSKGGIFYLKSPASLLNNYYSGFKSSRIYDYSIRQSYSESSWGALLSNDTEHYSLSLTISPRLTHFQQWDESSNNWSALQRSNASERYMISYSDYRLAQHTPGVNVMLGDSKSVVISDSYNFLPHYIFNIELAYHLKQQWRHLDSSKVQQLQNYRFPSTLYSSHNQNGIELAVGMQYTTNNFSQFGLEYYFQSEGYSVTQWSEQINLIRFLNQKTHYPTLDEAFDGYKYLMASEIFNASSKNGLLGKHYMNSYASFLFDDQSHLQSYVVLNIRDRSTLLGMNYSKPLDIVSRNLEIYTGIYSAFGSHDSEFALFGQTVATYLGFKYHF